MTLPDQIIREAVAKSGATAVGISLNDLETGFRWGLNEEDSFHAASTMKVCVLVELFRQAESGLLSLSDEVRVENRFASIADGSTYSVGVEDDSAPELHALIGQKSTLINLAIPMITRSSNLATNILVERLGAKQVTATMEQLGCHGLNVLRGVEDGKAYRLGLNNTVCAGGLTKLMTSLALGTAVSENASGQMVDILSAQEHKKCIPAGVPSGVRCANKTGWNTGICHDTSIVFPPGRQPYILTVLTSGLNEATDGPELIRAISRCVYESAVS